MNLTLKSKIDDGRIMRRQPLRGFMTRAAPSPLQTRAAELTTASFDPADNTIEVIFTTGATVRRRSLVDGPYDEELIVSANSVRLDRLNAGAPFLDTHGQFSLRDVIGSVVPGTARIKGGKGLARIKLSPAPSDADTVAKIKEGVIRNVSVGYLSHVIDKQERDGQPPLWRVTDWEPYEISAVPAPADVGCHVRGAEGDDEAREHIERAALLSGPQTLQLLERADFFGQRDLAERLIRDGHGEDAIMTAVQEARRQAEDIAHSIGGPRANLHDEMSSGGHRYDDNPKGRSYMHANARTLDNPHFLRQSLEDALYARMTGKPPEGAAREFIGAPLAAYDDILAESRGERRSWLSRGPGAWFGGSRAGGHTTSDFPNLLQGAGNRVLQAQYEVAQSPLLLLGRRRQSADFRPVNMLKISEAPELKKVLENGEVTYGSRGEEAEAFRVETFARLFSLSRQAYTNDDLGAFADFLQAFGRAGAETVAKQMVALFTANGGDGVNLSDASPLFTTGRKNKAASGAAIDVTSLGAARQALRETKGLDGVTPIGLTPRYIVVGPAKETQAEQAISQILANQVSNANPFTGKLEVLVEPRFTGNAWRVFADPVQQAVISYAYLNGQSGPMLETREGWTTLGVEFRAVLDFGCGPTDWRGAYLNPGA